MDQKIALLAGLVTLASESKVSVEVVRDLRDILSLFCGEVLPEDDYFELIEELKTENFVVDKDDFILLTREGDALSTSLSARILGQTSFEQLKEMLNAYKKDQKNYLRKISTNIKSLHDRHETKTKDEDMSQVRAIGMVFDIKHLNNILYVHKLKLSPDLLRDNDSVTKEINASVHKLIKTTGFPILTNRIDASVLEIISFARFNSFKLYSQEFPITDIQGIEHQKVSGWNKTVASVYLEHILNSLGYIRSHWPGRVFIKYNDFHRNATNLGDFRECSALEVDYSELSDDKIFIWFQTYQSPSKRLVDLIKENFNNCTSDQLLDILGNFKIKTIPSGSEIQIKRILPGKDVTKEKIPGKDLSIYEYWKETYGIGLVDKVQPIIIVEVRDADYHYPAETLFIEKYSLERYYKKSLERKTKTESPEKRARRSQELFSTLQNLRSSQWDKYVRINVELCNPSVAFLHAHGVVEKTLRIHQPMLEFNSGAISLDPANIFDSAYGAKCGYKTISISHFCVPKNISEAQINVFIKGLQKTFASAGFGKIFRSAEMKIIKFDNSDRAGFENDLRELEKLHDAPNHIGISLIPDGHSDFYYSVKRLFPSRAGVPVQAVALSSFMEAQEEKFRGFRILSLKILIKLLKTGEAIWTLSDNAGLLQAKTLYVGIGFSAFAREGKVSKCAAVLHDSKGNKISWKVFATIQSRTIIKPWFDNLLLKIQDIVDREKPERLVFYRTGTMFPTELDAINASLSTCDWVKTIKLSFVSILDGSNNRFFLSNNFKNIPAGYSIILNNSEAFLSSSNYDDRELRQGTIVPIKLKLEIGQDKIVDILKEYHDLTYLNWPAPYTTAKHPLLITIAERFSELTRENIPTENMFYLDL